MKMTETTIIKVDKNKMQTLVDSVREGLPVRVSCERAGIPYYYYCAWYKLYISFIEQKEKEGKVLEDCKELQPVQYTNKKDQKGIYYTPVSIIVTLKKMYGEFIAETAKTVRSGVKDKWQSAAWILERRCRAEYNKEEQVEDKKTVQAVKVTFVDPQQDKERIATLLKEVKENVGSAE